MSRYTDDQNLIDIFRNGINRGSGSGTPDAAPYQADTGSRPSSPAAHWLGMGIIGLVALSILGITAGQREQEQAADHAGPSSVLGFGMILGTLAIAAAALTALNRPAAARPAAPAP